MVLLQLPIIFYTSKFPGKPIDQSHGLIQKLGLEALINNGDWKAVENKVLQLSSDDISRVMDGMASQKNLTPKIEQYLDGETSEFQDVLAGNFLTKRAWDIRSGAWAKDVSEDQWAGFIKHLEMAVTRLHRPYESDPWKLEGISRLIHIYMGGGEKDDAVEAFNHCTEMDPAHYLSHVAMHRVTTPRWQGSMEEMIDFGNSIQDGHVRSLVQLSSLVEIYSDMYNENDEEDEHETRLRFQKEHDALIHNTLSNLKIPSGDSMLAIDVKNYLACVYSILNMKKDRDRYLKEVGGNITYRPWCYFGMSNARDVRLYRWAGML